MTEVVHEVEIAAPPEIVYACFTDPDELATWLAASTDVDARPGGRLTWTHENAKTVSGEFVELVPHRRVVFTYGWEDGWLDVPAGSTRVEVTLEPIPGGTRLRLTHHDLVLGAREQHLAGWRHFLDRLAHHLTDPAGAAAGGQALPRPPDPAREDERPTAPDPGVRP